ncbi:MobP3 family relaxase, partial [uncultured Oscillibacter sp.]|uniref:MobP3 family relaxase n=1 Tax=uncultured Oscillibacter sp. TaxID=876091 RepID=UPI00345846AB
MNEYPGNIWTHVISLKREDAERLGYDHAAQWRNLIRAYRNEIAAAMNIPPGDFRWYAAFHDEGGHPHIHMMAWSAKPGQAYLSKDGIQKIKSVLTNDIFKQEMLHTYEQKSASRDELVRRARGEMKSLVQEMQTCIGSHPEVESLMMTLTAQLETVKGKKKYGYLPKAVKKTVDEIVDQTEQLPVINECYQVWWELQCQIEDFYSKKERRRPPLSQQKEFRSVKNAVVQEAENIRMGKVTFEDEEMEESTDFSDLSYDCQELWMVTQ